MGDSIHRKQETETYDSTWGGRLQYKKHLRQSFLVSLHEMFINYGNIIYTPHI